MARDLGPEPTIPDEQGLREGLVRAVEMFVAETDLSHAVGESGKLRVEVELALDRGRGQHALGSVSFNHRFALRG
jgi:hypothetical protein